MTGPEIPSDFGTEREAVLARARTAATEALRRMDAAGRIVADRMTLGSADIYAIDCREVLVRLAVARLIENSPGPVATGGEDLLAAAANAIQLAQAQLPERLAELDALMHEFAPNEYATRGLLGLRKRFGAIANPRGYIRVAIENAKSTERNRERTRRTLSLDETDSQGRPLRPDPPSRANAPAEEALAAAMLGRAAESVTRCPACGEAGRSCPPEVELEWWLSAARRLDYAAHEIIDDAQETVSAYSAPTDAARWQRLSRHGYHATGLLLELFATADDPRLADPQLLRKGAQNHTQRAKQLKHGLDDEDVAERACCFGIATWCNDQLDRRRRRLPVVAATFPELRDGTS